MSSTTDYQKDALTQKETSQETDILNLHTYDFYDFFLMITLLLLFGLICYIFGCISNRKYMKGKYIHPDQMNESIANGQTNNNNNQNDKKTKIDKKLSLDQPDVIDVNKSYDLSDDHNNNRSDRDIELEPINEEKQQLSPRSIVSVNEGFNEEEPTIEIQMDLETSYSR